MTEKEKLLRDINGLQESIRQQWKDIASLELTREDRLILLTGIDALVAELAFLKDKLKTLENSN